LKTGGRGSILVIPPLRNRKEDIPILAGRFLEQLTDESGYPVPDLSATAVEALSNYCWPGNVRELKVVMSWALEKGVTARIGVDELPPAIRGALQKSPESSFPARLAALEYEALKEELSRQRGNMTKTARALGLTPRQVSWRVRKYGIEPRDFKPDRIKQR
jgi:DNA-binding NtrC family response regulator